MKTNDPKQNKDDVQKSNKNLTDESKVTKEDLEALGPKSANLSDDGGDDEQLLNREKPVDFTGKQMDVPGSELDDAQESVGSEDEENNFYSTSNEDENK